MRLTYSRLLMPLVASAAMMDSAYGQEASSTLFVCNNGDGSTSIVSAAQATGNCEPYRKGMLGGGGGVTTAPSVALNPHSPHILTADPAHGLAAPAPTPTPAPASTPSTTANGFVLFDQASAPPTPTQPLMPVPATSAPVASKNEEASPAQALVSSIYICITTDGRQEILEATTPPYPHCQSAGQKAGGSAALPAAAAPQPQRHKGKPSLSQDGNTQIATTDSAPQDIYKCFDHSGNPTFVRADERAAFKGCTFFSRSFAGVAEAFRNQALSNQSITELAKAGLMPSGVEVVGPRLVCTGSGTVSFNGQLRQFNCATRSFDLTPGTSGGEVRLGDRQASIAAHRLDYLNTDGSCGGIVTAENGRVLHLEPTKDCPESFKIEARRIAQEVERALNINVSGAFKERQRGLAAQINQIAAQVGVDPYLVHAVISAESAYKSRAVSHAGAQGLMQLMPATARRFNVSDSFNTGENIRGGTTYLKWLLKEFNGNMELAVAGYNAGEGNVRKYGYKIPPFIETKAYVPKVMEYYRRYRANPSEIGL